MPHSRLCVYTAALVIAFNFSQSSRATPIVVVGTGTSQASIPMCTNTLATFLDCTSTAFVSNTDATITSTFLTGNFNGTAPTDQTFLDAFDNWNFSQTTGVAWTIMNGGALNFLTLTVDPFTAGAHLNTGGIDDITVSLTMGAGYSGPPLAQLVWTQALYTNDSPTTPFGSYIVPPAITLDNYSFSRGAPGPFSAPCQAFPAPPANSNNQTVNIGASPAATAYCDPIYPFQYGDKHLFDAPQLSWPSASFRAIALLSTVSETTNNLGVVTAGTLTVYDGIEYGFDLRVPEPGSMLLLLGGLLALLAAGLRRRARPVGN